MNPSAPRPTQTDQVPGPRPSAAAEQELAALREAISRALDRKRRLGQYAVVWQDGKVRRIPPEALPEWPAGSEGAGTHYGSPPLMQVLAAREPLPEAFEDPEDPEDLPPQPPVQR